MRAGDVLVMESAGGGGWGDPLDREPAAVADDVAQGYLDAAEAERRYGLRLDADGRVDPAGTATARQELRGQRRWLRVTTNDRQPYAGTRGRRRLAYVGPDAGLAEGALVEVHGPHPAPLRAWVRHDPDLTDDQLALDDDGLEILGAEPDERTFVRVLADRGATGEGPA